jgi:hypothetical protein
MGSPAPRHDDHPAVAPRLDRQLFGDHAGLVQSPGPGHRREVGGWVCVEADGAYAAVRPARGGYRWAESDDRVRQGDWMVLEDGFAPVIIEVARKVDYADYQAFQDAVLARAPQWSANRLDYTGLSGVALTFHADCSAPPEIDGAAITYSPPKVFDSPFVSSEWNSAYGDHRQRRPPVGAGLPPQVTAT